MKPRVVMAGDPTRMPLVTNGLSGSLGIAFLLVVMPTLFEQVLGHLAGDAGRAQVDEHEVVVGAARDEAQTALDHRRPHRLGVDDDLVDVGLELGLHGLTEGDRLGSDDVLERAALQAREDRLVQRGRPLFLAQHEARTRAAQRLVRGRGHEIGVAEPATGARRWRRDPAM